ncbi:hypothetical protein [Halobacterium sp. R2-5]|uniref:hypothetical protein n=1 Tax=Halobacterium sp. R2-5 TaxID=2715751 RepID=UPI00141F3D7B|nr:hypothetical protein [Halobacterium sp. R2-5]NIC00934.1 hypothetical protein [Halobacterium sp. R2-5]
MVKLTDTEAALVDQLLDAVETVLVELPDVDPSYANKTKLQKLLYLAIDEFEIPVTYSWYLAGAVVPDRDIGPDAVTGGPSGPTGPDALSHAAAQPSTTNEVDDASPEGPSVDPILFTGDADGGADDAPADVTTYVTREELHSFYRREVPDVWHQETMRFLQNFYQEMAPEAYRLLYIESTHLRANLSELADAVACHVRGDEPARSITAIRESIELSISDLHYHLRRDDRLAQTFDVVVDGTDLVEDVLVMVDQRPRDELTEGHVSLLDDLQDFFYFYVWKYPCLLVSQETATGPRADALRSERAREFESFEERVRDRQRDLAAEFDSAGLLPGPDDYEPVTDPELSQRLSDLSSQYLE